jgi:hypothetical protein
MAARYPIRSAVAFRHAPQSSANANRLAGGSACRYGPLVLKGQNVPNIVCAGSLNVRILLSPLGEAREEFLSER